MLDWVVSSPKSRHWSPNPQCDCIWNWVFREVTKVTWGHNSGTPVHTWLVSLQEDIRDVGTEERQGEGVMRRWISVSQGSLGRNQTFWHIDLFQPLERWADKFLLFKPSGLVFGMAALTDIYLLIYSEQNTVLGKLFKRVWDFEFTLRCTIGTTERKLTLYSSRPVHYL